MKRNQLLHEAVEVTKEIGNDITFIGAIAIYLHTRTSRQSQDIDFVVSSMPSDDELFEKGYKRIQDTLYTQRGFKVDYYTRNPINDIPLQYIIETAEEFDVNPKRDEKIRVANLEVMIVAKKRAGRNQDSEDLATIAQRKFKEIKWDRIQELARDDYEFKDIKMTIDTLRNVATRTRH